MRFMLDTNICIYLIKQKPEKVLRHFKAHSVGEIGISSITLAELRYGVERSQQVQKNRQALKSLPYPLKYRLLTRPRLRFMVVCARARTGRNACRVNGYADRRPCPEPRSNIGDK